MKPGPAMRLEIVRTVRRTLAGHERLLPDRGAHAPHRVLLFSLFVAFSACALDRAAGTKVAAGALRRLARELEMADAPGQIEARIEFEAEWEAV